MSKQEKSGYYNGSLMADTMADPEKPEHKPDTHNYDFLSLDIDFSIYKHSLLLMRFIKCLKKSRILDYDVFSFETAEHLAPLLCRAAKIEKFKKVLFRDSLFPRFSSRPTNDQLIFDIAMVIAGNLPIITEFNQLIVPNYDLKYPAWIPMTIQDVKDDPEKPVNKKVSFFADSGIFAGSVISKYMNSKFIKFVLSQIGMTRRAHSDVRDIFGTKMSVLMMREGSNVVMSEFSTSTSQESYNKQLFKIRHGDRPCHMGMTSTCSECAMGTDKCEYAVYKKTML